MGKGTVSTYIRDNYPEVWLSVSATTRAPRPGEKDGVHYFFKTAEEFESLVAAGEFLEWAVVHGRNRYGTLRSTVDAAIAEGRSVLLEIDLQAPARSKRLCRRQSSSSWRPRRGTKWCAGLWAGALKRPRNSSAGWKPLNWNLLLNRSLTTPSLMTTFAGQRTSLFHSWGLPRTSAKRLHLSAR